MIEARLSEAGWALRSTSSLTQAAVDRPSAVREYPASDARIDYALCMRDRVLGIVETISNGESLSRGLTQTRHLSRLVQQLPTYQGQFGVPFVYSTDGLDIDFLDVRRRQNRIRRLTAFHTLDALDEFLDRDTDSELAVLGTIPLSPTLRHAQAQAIHAIESAIADGRRKMILSMAQGTGKTVTVVTEIYRLMRAGLARRVLVLQPNRALVAQTVQAFNSLEVEPGLSLETMFPVYSSSLGKKTETTQMSRAEKGVAPTPTTQARFVQVSTVSEVAELLRDENPTTHGHDRVEAEAIKVPIHTFDLIVAQDCDRPRSDSDRASLREVIGYFDAIRIGISSAPVFEGASEFDNFVAYNYDFKAAVRDGSLVSPEAVRTRPSIQRGQVPAPYDDTYKHRRVFLGYAYEDAQDAALIADGLRAYGVNVRPTNYDRPPGVYFPSQIFNELTNQDTFVILLSPASVDSPWVENRLDETLERRGVEIIPALLKPCPVPRPLADRAVVDLSNGIRSLLDSLEANARTDLKSLSPQSFERLTLDLLRRLYFDVDEPESTSSSGYDFHGVFQDVLGFADPVEYLIQVKFYKSERSSVSALQAFTEVIAADERHPRGLLVTNGQLTSVASKVLGKINDGNIRLVLIDGLKFKSLLLRYPDLIGKYFPTVEAADENG